VPNIKPIQPKLHLEVLTAEQLAEIKSATLHVLEHVGVHFPSERALCVFAEHGAQVDSDSQIVRMSPDLVLEALSHAPRSYVLSGRAEGIDTGDDNLALDVIVDVGSRAHFLAQDHTRRHMRDIWIPGLTHPRPSFDDKPQPDIRQRAKAELDRILAEHHPEPLEETVQVELQVILNAAAREFVTHS